MANQVAVATTKQQAALEVDQAIISPWECFVTFRGNAEGWAPLHGTGCAHFVAHKLNIRRGQVGIDACDQGYVIKVSMLIQPMTLVIDPTNVKVNDVWANHGRTHCGLVTEVQAAVGGKKVPNIKINHCASNEAAHRLGPRTDEWMGPVFHGGGQFYRPQ